MTHFSVSRTQKGGFGSCVSRRSDHARSHGSAGAFCGSPIQRRGAAAVGHLHMKTPPISEDVDGVFRAFTSRKVAALGKRISRRRLRSHFIESFFITRSCRTERSEQSVARGCCSAPDDQVQNGGRANPLHALPS